jgi:hypothetical protein
MSLFWLSEWAAGREDMSSMVRATLVGFEGEKAFAELDVGAALYETGVELLDEVWEADLTEEVGAAVL